MGSEQAIVSFSWVMLMASLAIGAGFAFLLYWRSGRFESRQRLGLAFLRGTIIAIIAYLLLGPAILLTERIIEKPLVILAVDDSESITLGSDKAELKQFQEQFQGFVEQQKGLDIELKLVSLSGKPIEQLTFSHKQSNLSSWLNNIQEQFEGRAVSAMVLCSDGIANRGAEVAFLQPRFKTYSIGLGDPTPRIDISVASLVANKIAYLGNKFPIQAEVKHYGYAGQVVTATLANQGGVIEKRQVSLTSKGLESIEFLVSATAKGLQRYTLTISPLPGELLKQNNSKDVVVDVVDGKERILLIALAPHPDIKAIKNAIEAEQNFELLTYVSGQGIVPEGKFDLVIVHNLPDVANSAGTVLDKWLKTNIPMLYIVGAQTSLSRFNPINGLVTLQNTGAFDKVSPSINPDFALFNYNDEAIKALNQLPPLSVPFGNVGVSGQGNVLLYQKVGQTVTTKPMLVLGQTPTRKVGVMLGEGLWGWRLQEYADNQNHNGTDALIKKVVQYLSAKDDKNLLRVNPTQNATPEGERLALQIETYNKILERVYNQPVKLIISAAGSGQRTEYTYTPVAGGSPFLLPALPAGVYAVQASALLSGNTETATAQFVIQASELESQDLQARHDGLQTLSTKSGGKFFLPTQLDQVVQALMQVGAQPVIRSFEELKDLIKLPWLLPLLIVLLSIEWALRKYWGGY